MAAFLLGTKTLSPDDDGFVAALGQAHAARLRPKCLCLATGVDMYVARLGDTFIVKRMPNTGSSHAPGCPSYEPPAESSGLGQLLGTAIQENPATGVTMLKLGFSMLKLDGRAAVPAQPSPSGDARSDGSRMTLRALLHYLWDQAELTRWQPGFAGKRSWGTVRRHLLAAAENKIARGEPLRRRLYIPEVFSVEERDQLNRARVAQWRQATATVGKPRQLMLLIGEVKEITPARYGFKAVIKHVPDQAFALDEQLYRRLERRFEGELALWSSAETVHMVAIATFGLSEVGVPVIAEMSLMPVTPQWLPIEDSFDRQLVDHLVASERSFIRGLRYNMAPTDALASATLIDVGDEGIPLVVQSHEGGQTRPLASRNDIARPPGSPAWVWFPLREAMPPIPKRAPARSTSAVAI